MDILQIDTIGFLSAGVLFIVLLCHWSVIIKKLPNIFTVVSKKVQYWLILVPMLQFCPFMSHN